MTGPPPGPVKKWADMTPEEKAQIEQGSRPPPKEKPVLPFPSWQSDVPPERRGPGGRGVELEVVELKRETSAAELWEMEGGEEVWWPRSQILSRELEEDGSGTITVTAFIARQREYA